MPPRLKVLLVEDNPADAALVRALLGEAASGDLGVEHVTRLAPALERLAAGGVDLVLVDLGLPDSQGLDTFRRLQEAAPLVPAVVLTGTDDDEVATAAVRLGAQDYLLKGRFDGSSLVRAARYSVERVRAQGRERLARQVLEQLNSAVAAVDAIRGILSVVRLGLGMEAVGIRLREGEDFPYYQTTGFPPDFLEAERHLCERDGAGALVRDAAGLPVLECMCGRVLRGRTDPSLPHFTPGGSFWTNGTTELGAGYRNRCNTAGYQSVALVPLRSGAEVIGLLQLNDHRPGRFTLETVELVEGLGASIGIAIHRKQTEERLDHLVRVLRAVRAVDQLVVRERDAEQLLREACGLLVEHRGYGSALLVACGPTGAPLLWAQAGMGAAFAPLEALLARGALPACCSEARLRSDLLLVEGSSAVCRGCPAPDECRLQDKLCIRLEHGGTVHGCMAVSLEHARGLDAEERALFTELAGDLGFALHGMAQARVVAGAAAERASLEAQMRQAQKMEAVGRLAGGVAHDFNNALSVVLTASEFLEEKLQGREDLLEDVRAIAQAGASAARLTKQLLAFSRRQLAEPRVLDLNATVRDLDKMVRRLLGEDIAIRLDLAQDVGPVFADPGQLEQVIVNLAVNARDALPEGGTLTLSTAGALCDGAPFVRLTVADDGCGMDEATKARLFEPFFTTKEKGKGTGLGLSTVYGIVGQCGGHIEVASAPGRGAAFDVYLPVAGGRGAAAADAQPRAPSSLGGSETVLVVEDDQGMRWLAARILRGYGYRVLEADGLEAARRAAASEPVVHLVLTDVVMPGGDGRQAGAAVLALHPEARVLYMSGYTDEMMRPHGALEPGVNLLIKPFTAEALGARVRQVLDGPPSAR